jgi:NAD(P)-dependent dehydrogenase (short-subunit alcohol dehydrogenase family)
VITKLEKNSDASLSGKVIIFSGGSGYLGAAMAKHLLDCGATLINLGRNKPDIMSKYTERAKHYSVDFYDTEKLTETLTDVVNEFECIDILVNNSFDFSSETGFNDPSGRLENLKKDTFLKAMESGIYWPLLCSQIVGSKMIDQGYGNIINITSLYSNLVADYRIYKGRKTLNPVNYPIAKHGLLGLTKYIASFWSEHNIRCNCLSPGTFPNIQNDTASPNKVKDDEFINILNNKCSMGRVGKPDDLLTAIEFLCSEKSSYMTGTNIVVDGGWSVL